MLYLFIGACFLLSLFCFLMWRYSISQEQMQNQRHESAQQTSREARLPSRSAYPEAIMHKIEVPDYFDEHRINQDLARLANTPGMLAKYIERARSRFTKKSQRAILEHYITLYKTGKQVVDARTE